MQFKDLLLMSGILLFLMLLSAFFSLSETALVALSKIKLRNMLAKGVRRAQYVQRLAAKMDKFIAAILVGNNFVNVAITAIMTVIFVEFLGQKTGIIISTVVTASVVVVFCEVTPKLLATKNPERASLFMAPIMEFIIKVFNPVISLFTRMSNFLLSLFRVESHRRLPLITEEELRLLIEIGKEEGVLTEEERKMLVRIFEFGDIKVKDVMVPLEKIVSVSISATPEQVLDTFAEEGHARIPVYSGSKDNIIGIIYARDLLYILRDGGLFVVADLIQKPYYVSAYMSVNELLRRFQAQKIQIAIVVNEKQKAIGLVTLEDLIEEIVGEIEEIATSRTNHK
ncbi:MAG: hemolysin family protein [Candidatus Omnitrophica bacterium]|nr:hemolysin family protein [Candidatus Omnitrophota bacterium]